MVLETTKDSGAYILGFRIDPYDKMKDIVQEIHSLYQVYHTSPIFGVDYDIEDQVGKCTCVCLPIYTCAYQRSGDTRQHEILGVMISW